MTLGEKIRRLREEKGLKQQDIADILSLSRVAVTNYEGGKRIPDVYTLKYLADYFGVTVDYLLDEET